MPIITLSDGSQRYYSHDVSPIEVALDIDINLAQNILAGYVNKKLVDISDIIKDDAMLSFITKEHKESLYVIRNSCMYLLGYTIKQLWPNAKMVVGLVNKNGFYYDIEIKDEFSKKEIDLIDKYMHDLIKKKLPIIKKQVSWHQAKEIFIQRLENYKVSFLNEMISHDKVIKLCLYKEYVDIVQGPIVPDIQFCQYFKLINISSSYWKKNDRKLILQRIQGTAWTDKQSLSSFLKRFEEYEKYDHRKIGKKLDLFHLQEEAPGMVFWHSKGWIVFRELEMFIQSKLQEYGYQEVKTPFLMDKEVWRTTGHWDNYQDAIFTTSSEHREYCIKPMNCPGHIQIFNQKLRSYRDLPLRIAEFGSCHRNEKSGALHGLMRVRSFTQDDAHIFCTEKQLHNEINACIRMVYDVYNTFGFKKILVKLSTRPEKRIGNDEIWDHAEKNLAFSLKENNLPFTSQSGEGALYGPKIEFTLYDSLNREWQCGTVQLDFCLPKLLHAFYISENNKRCTPIMIHRAILGSMERFIGILIEEFSGYLPTWLAPIQVVVINVTDAQSNYVNNITKYLKNAGIRAKSDLRNEKIGFKIREHVLQCIPYMIVCGERETKTNSISIRTRNNKQINNINIYKWIKKIKEEIHCRSLQTLEG